MAAGTSSSSRCRDMLGLVPAWRCRSSSPSRVRPAAHENVERYPAHQPVASRFPTTVRSPELAGLIGSTIHAQAPFIGLSALSPIMDVMLTRH